MAGMVCGVWYPAVTSGSCRLLLTPAQGISALFWLPGLPTCTDTQTHNTHINKSINLKKEKILEEARHGSTLLSQCHGSGDQEFRIGRGVLVTLRP